MTTPWQEDDEVEVDLPDDDRDDRCWSRDLEDAVEFATSEEVR